MFKEFVLTSQKTHVSLILLKGIIHIHSANNKKCKQKLQWTKCIIFNFETSSTYMHCETKLLEWRNIKVSVWTIFSSVHFGIYTAAPGALPLLEASLKFPFLNIDPASPAFQQKFSQCFQITFPSFPYLAWKRKILAFLGFILQELPHKMRVCFWY
jgi:hypothetical protein